MKDEISPLQIMSIPECIIQERMKQDAKWGEQNHHALAWFSILSEEVGEVAECLNKAYIGPFDSDEEVAEYRRLLEIELIQVASVVVAWLECIRRRKRKAEVLASLETQKVADDGE